MGDFQDMVEGCDYDPRILDYVIERFGQGYKADPRLRVWVEPFLLAQHNVPLYVGSSEVRIAWEEKPNKRRT